MRRTACILCGCVAFTSIVLSIVMGSALIHAAHAGPVYRWETLFLPSRLHQVEARIEFSDGFDTSRPVDFGDRSPACGQMARDCFLPVLDAGPVRSFDFTVNGVHGAVDFLRSSYFRVEIDLDPAAGSEAGLSGSIFVGDIGSDFQVAGGEIWTLLHHASDNPAGGCFNTINDCHGATGVWRLADSGPSPSTVPEPGSLALLSVGFAGLARLLLRV